MATIEFRGVGAAHGPRTLFADLDLVLAPGDVAGLTGPNGAGKSTLLSAAAGAPAAEMSGTIFTSPPDATVGLLEQEVERRDETVAEFVARRTGVTAAAERMDALAEAMADDPAAADEYSLALERWLALGGADLDERLPRTVADLGLDDAIVGASMRSLSGGQAARANLAVILLAGHDILLLDEPTNDLDLDGIERLEAFIAAERRPMLIVSHDREFLARTITRMVELDAAQRQIVVFDGGYEAFLAERELRRRRAREAYEEYAGDVDKLKGRLQTQKTWLDKGTRNAMRAHGGKNPEKDKHIRHRAGQRSEKQAGKISQTERANERLDVVEEPRKEWELRMSIAAAPWSGTVVATLRDAAVRYAGYVLGPVSLQINQGDRVLVEGPNGSGKSTLLSLLVGERAPDEGEASTGSGVIVGRNARVAGRGGADAPGEVRADRRARRAPLRFAVARRAHPRGAGAAAGPRHQHPGARRADQPPGPAGDRAAGAGGRVLRRHRAAGHPRPADARRLPRDEDRVSRRRARDRPLTRLRRPAR